MPFVEPEDKTEADRNFVDKLLIRGMVKIEETRDDPNPTLIYHSPRYSCWVADSQNHDSITEPACVGVVCQLEAGDYEGQPHC